MFCSTEWPPYKTQLTKAHFTNWPTKWKKLRRCKASFLIFYILESFTDGPWDKLFHNWQNWINLQSTFTPISSLLLETAGAGGRNPQMVEVPGGTRSNHSSFPEMASKQLHKARPALLETQPLTTASDAHSQAMTFDMCIHLPWTKCELRDEIQNKWNQSPLGLSLTINS